jgi:tellurite resistance protein
MSITDVDDLRAQGDRDLAERLTKEPTIRRAMEQYAKKADELGARRHLLATAVRLTPDMAPDLHELMESCRSALSLQTPLEPYVYPQAAFNAAAVRPERGRLFVLVSSGLLEAFDAGELRFVVGHELGHHLFEHHAVPVPLLTAEGSGLNPALALQLFSWQRYAEISCDRAGVYCAGELGPAASALFKLASGLHGSGLHVRLEHLLAQLDDLQQEVADTSKADEPVRGEWFASHPFSPLRLRAAELFAGSELMRDGGTPRTDMEAQVQELMDLMNPSYLHAKGKIPEAMRRLLLAGGVLVAAATGAVSRETLEALEQLLGVGSIPSALDPEAIRQDLPRRVALVKEVVPPLRRAQVIRDLCLIARADGVIDDDEAEVLQEIATAVEVDAEVVACAASEHRPGMAPDSPKPKET